MIVKVVVEKEVDTDDISEKLKDSVKYVESSPVKDVVEEAAETIDALSKMFINAESHLYDVINRTGMVIEKADDIEILKTKIIEEVNKQKVYAKDVFHLCKEIQDITGDTERIIPKKESREYIEKANSMIKRLKTDLHDRFICYGYYSDIAISERDCINCFFRKSCINRTKTESGE